MNARYLLAAPALALVLAASPAAARSDTAKMADKMRDPGTQRAMAAAVAAMSEAMMDIPLEPFARAAEAMGDRRTSREMRGATVGDVAGPDARYKAREMSRALPAMMGAMGGMADEMEKMTPALKAMAREMGARMGEAMERGKDAARNGRDARDDEDYRDEGYRSAPRRDDDSADAPPPAAQEEPDQGDYATPAPDQDETGL